MQDLTELRMFLASLLRPIINEAIKEQLRTAQNTQQAPQELPELLDIKGASQLLGLSIGSVYQKIFKRTIPHIKRKGVKKIYFSRTALLSWLNEGEQPTQLEIRTQAKKSLEKNNYSKNSI